RRGLFREAHGGTLLLDEIGDIAPSVQNKLLRVLQEREIKPVGGDQFIKVDVRILAATNKDLKAAVARGDFREDLYWRLAVMPMQVPPLRERREDIPLLAMHILAKRFGAAKNFGGGEVKYPSRISQRAMAKLVGYKWPGNIRELENVLSRAALLCDGHEIHSSDLAGAGLNASSSPASLVAVDIEATAGRSLKELLDETVEMVERSAIGSAMEKSEGSATKAAKLLGISRATVYNKLRKYGMSV
ncbi:MAG: sigma-54-dependent Fis family transcriptional regulator, partial [Kofleriaceae bacterium]|nr:sigma-54-dependent Fis family transcriptional regulator [Kofleriaceae bacterium]